jgi:TRAP-type C4-dicarboxylate transport system permease small subunit
MSETGGRMEKAIILYERSIQRIGLYILCVPLFLMTIIETLNAVGRKIYIPFPCAVEAVESLLVVCVYFGISAVAIRGEHINVVVLTQKLSRSAQSALDAVCNFLGAAIFCFLSYAAWLHAIAATRILEVRTGVYEFHVWPFRIFFALGLTMLAIQLIINVIKHVNAAKGRVDYAGMDRIKTEELL